MKEQKVINVGLCDTHDELKKYVDGFFFGMVEKFDDIKYQENTILFRLYQLMGKVSGGLDFTPSDFKVNIYVTGLTIALISALNVCSDLGVKVTLYHWDYLKKDYFPQEIR